jgi:hypothetical protein
MKKPIGISIDQPILKQQLRLIDALAAGYGGLANVTCSKAVARKRVGLLDGLAEFISRLNAQLEKGGDIVVYPARPDPSASRPAARRRTSHCAILVLAVTAACISGIPSARANELDPGRLQTKAECSRILWVGGVRQSSPQVGDCTSAGGIHDDEAKHRRELRKQVRDLKAKQEKDAREQLVRDRKLAHDLTKDRHEREREARKAKQDAQKAKDKADREKRDHDHACRGLGLPAGCTLENPGHAKTKPGKQARAHK